MTPERGLLERAMAYLLGASWKTSLSGFITLIAYFIHDNPQWIHWIPEPLQGMIWSGSEYVFLGAFGTFAWRAKDKSLTGGSQQQTYNGKLVEPGKQNLVDATVEATPLEHRPKI